MEVPVMTNEELILQRLDRLEARLAPMSETFKSMMELKEDLTPLVNRGFKVLIEELQDVEMAFQLEDLFRLIKQGLRGIRNFSWSLEQLESLIDLLKTLEPLLKSTVPQLIHYLDDMEQKGVFRTYGAMLSVRAKVAKQYSPEDFELMSDAFIPFGPFEKTGHTGSSSPATEGGGNPSRSGFGIQPERRTGGPPQSRLQRRCKARTRGHDRID